MKVDKSVQGAADKLLGLLNPQEGQSEPKKDQPAPQEPETATTRSPKHKIKKQYQMILTAHMPTK